MASALRISEAASLALHSLALIAARSGELLSTKQIAGDLGISEAHLSKVLQRLAKVGLVTATRGPKGGFALGRAAETISLLEVYETIDGPVGSEDCALGEPVCSGVACVLGGLVKRVNDQMREYLAATRLSDVTRAYCSTAEE